MCFIDSGQFELDRSALLGLGHAIGQRSGRLMSGRFPGAHARVDIAVSLETGRVSNV